MIKKPGRMISGKRGCGGWVIQKLNKGPLRGLGPKGGLDVSSLFHVATPSLGPLFSSHSHMRCCGRGPSQVPASSGSMI